YHFLVGKDWIRELTVPTNLVFSVTQGGARNDLMPYRTSIYSSPYSITEDILGTTTSSSDPVMCAGSGTNSVWFEYFIPDYTATVSVDTLGSGYDTVLGIYTYNYGSGVLTEVACNDDSGGGLQSALNFTAQTDTEYYIMIGNYSATPITTS